MAVDSASPTIQGSAAGAPAGAAAVGAKGLWLRIDERVILRDIQLEIPRGQFVALLGANGAGKSTLLKLLATLTYPSAGQLWMFGQLVKRGGAGLRAKIGMIGHQAMLYRDLSARENLLFFGRLYGVDQPGRRAGELLERVGLAERADDPVKAFSRGMVQRVAIARALMHGPEILLADEPFAGLDVASTQRLEQLLGELHQEGKTIVLSSHDIPQALRLAERVVVLRRDRSVEKRVWRGGMVVMDQAARETDERAVLAEISGP
ncbi:MAG: ABC transporter ATP-binding protein [Phycisphaeraceae bacterium]|nr:ABC transporter ATP-binding protein [Phycisphaeraceae bacterium]